MQPPVYYYVLVDVQALQRRLFPAAAPHHARTEARRWLYREGYRPSGVGWRLEAERIRGLAAGEVIVAWKLDGAGGELTH